MVLKFIERDPAYPALLQATLRELLPIVTPRTGAMHQLEGFIFLSSPDSVTPLHLSPEHNILLQWRGTKTMTVFPQADEEITLARRMNAFTRALLIATCRGARNLPDIAARSI